MPSTPNGLFVAAAATQEDVVAWGERPELDAPGIYLISLSSDGNAASGSATPPVSIARCQELLDVRRELTIDNERPNPLELKERVASFWIPDEPVLYIGLAGTSVASRVAAYYRTPLGARRPHAGGWFLKTLDVLPNLWVHFASCDDPEAAEEAALSVFAAEVTKGSRARLRDSERVMPFANLEYPRGVRKSHGIAGAREPKERGSRGTVRRVSERASIYKDALPASVTAHLKTQRITAADLRAGQIRIPAQAKQLFPNEKARVSVELLGARLNCRWDPRPGRSGLIGVGRAQLGELVNEDQVLRVEASSGGVRLS